MRDLFVANMTALGIPAVVAPGETLHIDWINGTAPAETLLEIASKSYLDWYMLTQARVPDPAVPSASPEVICRRRRQAPLLGLPRGPTCVITSRSGAY